MFIFDHVISWITAAALVFIVYALYRDSKVDLDFQSNFREAIKKDIYGIIERLGESASSGFNRIKEAVDLAEVVETLRNELAALRIDKSRIEETFAREKREIEHKLGLERMRQNQELELAVREMQVKVREENLKAERDMFSKQTDAIQKRFEDQLKDQNSLIKNLLTALPNMHIVRTETSDSSRSV